MTKPEPSSDGRIIVVRLWGCRLWLRCQGLGLPVFGYPAVNVSRATRLVEAARSFEAGRSAETGDQA